MRFNFLVLITLLLTSCSSEIQDNSLSEHLNNEIGGNWKIKSAEKRELEELKEKLIELTNDVEMLTHMSKRNFDLENQTRELLNLEHIPIEVLHTKTNFKKEIALNYEDSPNKDLLFRADSSINILKQHYYIRSKSLEELLIKIQN
ncbi:hypothetical protein ACE193_09090 [Bernardetia sp. OM2101]|uniref:hypothetical protein n=1 Tax=Bernardetia sp. OM2101 TaxID=3344876 RepID=UPI0035D02B41